VTAYNDFVAIPPTIDPPPLPITSLVLIEWDDATQPSHGWQAPDDIDPTPAICRSVGWIIHRDDRAITLATTKCSHGDEVMGAMCIPLGTVRSVKVLSSI